MVYNKTTSEDIEAFIPIATSVGPFDTGECGPRNMNILGKSEAATPIYEPI